MCKQNVMCDQDGQKSELHKLVDVGHEDIPLSNLKSSAKSFRNRTTDYVLRQDHREDHGERCDDRPIQIICRKSKAIAGEL